MEKFVIIDGNSVLYREFFALPVTMKNGKGMPTNAIYGFCNQLFKIIKDYKPTHIAVSFDVSRHTFRNDLFDGYKATRKPMPDELRVQLEPLKQLLTLMGIRYIQKEGLEGDDIVGTLSKKFSVPTIIITGDRDTFQLIDDTTVVYLNKKGLTDVRVMDTTAMLTDYGVTPDEFVYVKSLAGDTSDNIPGVRGIGEKTALELVKTYKNLDNLYANIENIKGATKTKLQEHKEDAYLSYKLAKINTNVDIDCVLDDFIVKVPFSNEVLKFLKENAFRSLINKTEFFESEDNVTPLTKIGLTKESIMINSVEELKNLVKNLSNKKEVGFVEKDYKFHLSDGVNDYAIIPEERLLLEGLTTATILNLLKPIFENDKIEKVLFDSKSVRHFLDEYNISLCGSVFYCMIAKHLQTGESVTNLMLLTDDYERIEKLPALSLTESKAVLIEDLEQNLMKKLYFDVELPLSFVLYKMEKQGFKVDQEKLGELEQKYNAELESLTDKIHSLAGANININSPKQLAELIYDNLKLSKSKKRSTAMEVLEELEDKHEIIPLIIRYRKVAKYLSSFIKNMYEKIDSNGYIHTTFNQTLTTTGRLSSVDPNLQNIPVRGAEARDIRGIFVASNKDRVLVDSDYSQIELRVLAHLSGDEMLLKAFKENIDIHNQTAMAVFGVSEENVTPEMRRLAKVVNFGVNYGISEYGLSRDLKIPVYEAREYINAYFKLHPKIKEFMDNRILDAKVTGRAVTILGRTRKMTELNSSNYMVRQSAERASQNMPVQGSASDIIKLAMLKLDNELEKSGMDAKLIMQVHDELIVDCKKEDAEKVQALVQKCMSEAYPELVVPLVVDSTIAYRWSEGH